MADLSERMLPSLKSSHLPDLGLDREFIDPDYDGGSILNLPPTVCHLFDTPELGHVPLRPELLSLLRDQNGDRPPDRIILILMDALSLHRLQRWMSDGNAPIWGVLAEQGVLAPLTSLVPSTTTAALTTLWSGLSPAEHALAGYELWLKEYGVVANMIRHAPFSFQGDAGSLSRAGFDPQSYLTTPTLGTHLAAYGVKTYVLQHRSILHSSLSKMLFKQRPCCRVDRVLDDEWFHTVCATDMKCLIPVAGKLANVITAAIASVQMIVDLQLPIEIQLLVDQLQQPVEAASAHIPPTGPALYIRSPFCLLRFTHRHLLGYY